MSRKHHFFVIIVEEAAHLDVLDQEMVRAMDPVGPLDDRCGSSNAYKPRKETVWDMENACISRRIFRTSSSWKTSLPIYN